jgi:fumarylacetoacetase
MNLNETHDPAIRSWVFSANTPETDFPLQNLPFGVFRRKDGTDTPRTGIALGDQVIDIYSVAAASLLNGTALEAGHAASGGSLNRLMSLGPRHWSALRHAVFSLMRADHPEAEKNEQLLSSCIIPQSGIEMMLPAVIGDYTDFYASIYHATNVGSMLRPENPLLPNYKYLPVGYHGRSSSIVPSGAAVRRPNGQTREDGSAPPVFGPSRSLDYELELGVFIGSGNHLGTPVDVERAEQHLFGVCLLNDWSARDMQKWEYQPLGPFLAKNFCTTVSPWVVTVEALEPYRIPAFSRDPGDPQPLPHLDSPLNRQRGGIDITFEVYILSELMRKRNAPPALLSRGSFGNMYWTIAQMLVHHTSNGCNLRPGDLLGSGTVSGPTKESRGCLLELTWRGKEPVTLPSGESRSFLEDGDEIIIRGHCRKAGFATIGLGECRGTIVPAPRL